MLGIAARLESLRRQVADAADVVGRDPEDVTIIAVTKTVGIDDIRDALSVGLNEFGENRVQEFLGKYGLFPDADWHFIGSLQTNKVKDVVGRAALIHSVDSLHLLGAINKHADDRCRAARLAAGERQRRSEQARFRAWRSARGADRGVRHGSRRGPGADDHGATGKARGCPLGLQRASRTA